ncbi:MAG: glycosyltransferase family 2 protein [Bacteroidales bacterium]|nr:glycosyltransferase family 2 protein [Bacteroidales bacterium]
MLSILIPTYNFNCSKLCNELHKQAKKLDIEFEIRVYDDCSTINFEENSLLSALDNVIYKRLSINYGRSAIRNLMVDEAMGNYLLFLDCDGEIASKNYLSLYYKFRDDADVVCGGRIYPERDKIKCRHFLHWIYGNKRESKCNKTNAKSFMTNNFLIKKEVFNSTRFDQTMIGYGHEDTAFGIELKKKGFSFKIIKNPIIHIGLYDANDFIKNTRNSIDNLVNIVDEKYKIEDFFDIKLVKTYFIINKFGLTSFCAYCFGVMQKTIEKNLKSKHPNLCLLDIYKLGYYSKVTKQKNIKQ